jgi:DNA (cytosine-5)-methyltransferase 1
MSRIHRAVDVFGFAGAFTLGTVQSGFTLVGKRELPGAFGVANCESNRHLLGADWTTEVADPHSWTPVDVDYVFGNPPCSGFSVMTAQSARGIDAKVNECMWAFAGYAARCRPLVAAFESVRPAYVIGHPLMTALRAKLEAETGWRYNLYHVMHNAYELGGAAIRPRYFWVAARDDVPFGVDYPVVRPALLRDAWEDLTGLDLTWERQPYRREATWWSRTHVRPDRLAAVDGHVTHEGPGVWRAYDLLRAANENGGWPANRSISQIARHVYETTGTLPDTWLDKLEKLIKKDFDMGYTNVYRWNADQPGRVIIGGALQLVLHPTEDRMITHREAARVMGFPDDWLIKPMRGNKALPMTWGKGITVHCGRWLSTQVKNALDGNPGRTTGIEIADREFMVEPIVKYGKVRRTTSDIVIEQHEGNAHV